MNYSALHQTSVYREAGLEGGKKKVPHIVALFAYVCVCMLQTHMRGGTRAWVSVSHLVGTITLVIIWGV